MLKSLAAFAFLFGTAATAQSVSYLTNNPSRLVGDPNKIVCEKEEKIGTRLGGERVCHTVAEWNQIHDGVRENAERLQAGTWGVCGDGANSCGANSLSIGDMTGGVGGPH
jgi:hypothetical protein